MRRLTNDELNKKLKERGKHLKVIQDCEDKNYVICRCTVCKQTFKQFRKNLFSRYAGCPVCKGYYIIRGFNDIATTNQWMMKYFVDENVGYTHVAASEDKVLVKCPYCGSQRKMIIGNLYKRGFSCPCKKNFGCAITGINDVATRAPWMISYFVDSKNAYTCGCHSTKEFDFKCPNCKTIITRKVVHVYRNGFCCPVCSDGVSYPNKLLRFFLMNSNARNIEFEYIRDWTETRFYDAYFELNDTPYLVEMDSGLHFKSVYGKSLQVIKSNDAYKDILAKKKGIQLIRVQFTNSNLEEILESMKKTILAELFDLNSFDWNGIDKAATNSLVVKICEEYNKNELLQIEIANKYGINKKTVCEYISKGKKIGLCNIDLSSQKRAQIIKRNRNYKHEKK